jgi:hypothetical protein
VKDKDGLASSDLAEHYNQRFIGGLLKKFYKDGQGTGFFSRKEV